MIEELGVVSACDGEYAWVHTQRRSTCGQCAARQGCGTAVLAKFLGRNFSRVRALNSAAAGVGDTVIVGLREEALLRGSAAVYLVPLLAMFAMAMLGEVIAPQLGVTSEPLSIGFAMLGLVLGFVWLRVFSARNRTNTAYQPIVVRRVAKTSSFNPPHATGSIEETAR